MVNGQITGAAVETLPCTRVRRLVRRWAVVVILLIVSISVKVTQCATELKTASSFRKSQVSFFCLHRPATVTLIHLWHNTDPRHTARTMQSHDYPEGPSLSFKPCGDT